MELSEIYGIIIGDHLELIIPPIGITGPAYSTLSIDFNNLIQIANRLNISITNRNRLEISNLICDKLLQINHLLSNSLELHQQINEIRSHEHVQYTESYISNNNLLTQQQHGDMMARRPAQIATIGLELESEQLQIISSENIPEIVRIDEDIPDLVESEESSRLYQQPKILGTKRENINEIILPGTGRIIDINSEYFK